MTPYIPDPMKYWFPIFGENDSGIWHSYLDAASHFQNTVQILRAEISLLIFLNSIRAWGMDLAFAVTWELPGK